MNAMTVYLCTAWMIEFIKVLAYYILYYTIVDITFVTHRLTLELAVFCDQFYFGPSCDIYCQPRNDFVGHYTCNSTGMKQCLKGNHQVNERNENSIGIKKQIFGFNFGNCM